MLKKVLTISIFVISLICMNFNEVEATDVWVYTDFDENSIYVVYESVVYGVRTSFYAKSRIKFVDSSGKLLKMETMEIGHDEGDWRYGFIGTNIRGRRVYDYEDATAILRWLQAHESEAHRTANMFEKVLGD